jgi:AraC family transcriptional regulator, arabinose operon regulatory protein
MKSAILTVTRQEPGAGFQINRLGLHEKMRPCMVDRPQGTNDYLLMFFHSEVWVRSTEGETCWATPGLMVWTPPDGHYYGNLQSAWSHSWMHCSGPEVGAILKACAIPVRKRIPVADPSLMEHFILEAMAELGGWSRPDATILRNYFENFARSVSRHISRPRRPKQLAPAGLLAVRSYVEQHFMERLSLGRLASQAGWSPPHLCTEFRRFFGIPVIQFVQQLRMNRAIYLLRDHNRRIGEIGNAVGYADLYTFSKMFKRCVGLSPTEFRARNFRIKRPAAAKW